MLRAFLRLYDSWNTQMRETKWQYKIELWIFEPHRMETELIVRVKSNIGRLREPPFRRRETDIPFPFDFYRIDELKSFTWSSYYEDNYIEMEDVAFYGHTLEGLLSKGWQVSDQSTYLYKPNGTVWVGSK